jgi:hypothetical protein
MHISLRKKGALKAEIQGRDATGVVHSLCVLSLHGQCRYRGESRRTPLEWSCVGCVPMPGWAAAGQRCGEGGSTLAMGFLGVTVGGDPRCLTMGTASGAERRDAPTPGDRRPACAETLSLPIAARQLYPLRPCGREWRVPRVGCRSAAQDPLRLDIEGVDRLARGHE